MCVATPTVKTAMPFGGFFSLPAFFTSATTTASRHIHVKQEEQKKKKREEEQERTGGKGLAELTVRLQDQLAKITERVAHADSVIEQQTTSLSLLRRQQAVLERRVVALEEESVRMQQKIAETTRLASDVVLQHRNVEALVRQMEKLVLKHTSPRAAGASTSGAADEKPSSSPSPTSSISSPEMSARVSALGVRLESLQARVEQLTLEKIVLERVRPHLQDSQQPPEASVSRAAAAVAVAGGASDAGAAPPSPKLLAAVLKNTGAFPFKDSTGATRVSSQKVLVRGVPVNFGASEVRDLFSRVGTVVSCVVRRMPIAPAAVAETPQALRYRSQQEGEAAKTGSDTPTRAAADEQERAFEVTFQAAEQAVRAVLQLDGYQLGGKAAISVEPVVAADIIAALQLLEREPRTRQ